MQKSGRKSLYEHIQNTLTGRLYEFYDGMCAFVHNNLRTLNYNRLARVPVT